MVPIDSSEIHVCITDLVSTLIFITCQLDRIGMVLQDNNADQGQGCLLVMRNKLNILLASSILM